MAAAIKGKYGFDAELIEGGAGVFDVTCGGRRLFSKHEAERFPSHEEILAAIQG